MSVLNQQGFLRKHLQHLEVYTPILPFEVLAEQLQRPTSAIIKLDANENPYGISPKTRQALQQLEYPHIYPDPESRALRQALAGYTGVPAENLLVGAGADELLDMLVRIALEPHECVLNCPPTFGMYPFDTEINAGQVINVPRQPDFRLDLLAVVAAVQQHAPKIVFVTSPNNPDGGVLSDADLDALLALPVLVVLDEAYIEFSATPQGRITRVLQHDNLVVLRTFSKWAGLAGLRVGYGAFPTWLITALWQFKQPYNVNVAAQQAALAALDDLPYLQGIIALLVQQRDRLYQGLANIAYLAPFPSQANFILCNVRDRSAKALQAALAAQGILVRYYAKPGLANMIRVSVGLPAHTDALLAALQEL